MAEARILLIEDEAIDREILEIVLDGAGYPVDAVGTAADAHARMSATRYGLVVADWLLPDGDGIYLADRALAQGAVTLIVTSHISDLPPGTGQRHHLLTKPIRPADLLAVVRALIGEPKTDT